MRGDFRMRDNKKHNRYFFCCASWISKKHIDFFSESAILQDMGH